MKRVLIAGIGNVLLGDDGLGPYVLHQLEAAYTFEEGVKLEDLGTPALDFIDHLAGLDALIVVDSVANDRDSRHHHSVSAGGPFPPQKLHSHGYPFPCHH